MRASPDLAEWLSETSTRLGVSQNALLVGAVEQLRRIIGWMDEFNADATAHGSAMITALGPAWVEKLLAMGIENNRLRAAWDVWLQDQDSRTRSIHK